MNVVRLPIDPYAPEKPTPVFLRGDHVELAEYYAANIGEAVHDRGQTFTYDATGGVWAAVDPSAESCTVQGYAGLPYGPKAKPLDMRAGDVTGVLKLAHARLARPGFFDDARQGLGFADGFVTVDPSGPRLLPHAKENRARFRFGFAFAGGGEPVRFLQFLRELWRDDADCEEKILYLQEFAGACMTGLATVFQKSAWAEGGGGNGKSALIDIVSGVMPPGSVSSIAPQLWSNEYRRAALAGALLNVVSELPEADILESERFKAIVTGDPTDAREIFKAVFSFRPRCGHLFALNRLPGTSDTSSGFWRRIDVLSFNRRFDGEAANPHIAREILEAERPEIVRWFLAGASRALAQRGYTPVPSSVEAVRQWRRNANPVALFLEERTRDVKEGERWTAADSLYREFREWCTRNGHHSPSSTKFGMRMAELKGGKKGERAKLYPVVMMVATPGDPGGTLVGYPSGKNVGGLNGYS